jgi:RNA polymerase sigma factor (sigma-70 family)
MVDPMRYFTNVSPKGKVRYYEFPFAIGVLQPLRVGQVKLEANFSAESGNRLADEVRDRRPPSEDLLELEEDWLNTARRMERLDSRERTVLTLHFGLEGEVLTLKEIGRRFGMTRERVRSIERRAIRKLSDDRCERTFARCIASPTACRNSSADADCTRSAITPHLQLRHTSLFPKGCSGTGC